MSNNNKIASVEEIYDKIEKRFPGYKCEILKYTGHNSDFEIKCLHCNKTFKYSSFQTFIRNGKVRPCTCFPLPSQLQLVEEAKDLIKNSNLEYINWYSNKNSKSNFTIKLKCKNCGYELERTIGDLRKAQDCPICNGHKVNTESFSKWLENSIYNDYTLVGNYKGKENKVLIRHKCGFIFKAKPENIKNWGMKCPKCNKNISIGEQNIIKFLTSNNIIFEHQVRYPEKLGRKSFDFRITLQNGEVYLIEFQGAQHYEEFGFTKDNLAERQIRDQQKRDFCIEQGYHLIEIPYYDINHVDKYLLQFIGSTTILPEEYTSSEVEKTSS